MNLDIIKKSRKLAKELRCVHRHSIEEHPACFAKGLIKWPDDKTFVKLTDDKWYNFPEYKVCYVDIETDNLNADFGTVLSWCIKEKDKEVKYSVITKEELFNGTVDKRLTEEFVEEISKYKIVVGYYSSKFDIPYMRSKALHWNLDFPEYGSIFTWDLYYTIRYKLKLSRNSLDNACDYLGIKGKTPIDKESWRKAKYGDEESLNEVLTHNKFDVIILEELHNRVEFARKWLKTSI